MEDSGEDSTQISNKNSDQEAPDDDKEIEKCPELEEKTVDNSEVTNDQESVNKQSNNLINSTEEMEAESPSKNSLDNQQEENIPSPASDDDDDEEISMQKTTKSRFQTIIDSDSEDDTPSLQQPDSPVDGDASMKLKKQLLSFNDSDEDDNEDESQKNKENLMEDNESEKKSHKISALIDSESEEDEEKRIGNYPVEEMPIKSVGKKSKKQKVERKKNIPERASKEEAMRQIHMETQRLMREREVSLPYHRPKKRSLKEFLERKKFDPILPEAKTMTARVKRCASDVNKIIEERQKEAEELFKSESEDEDVDKCYIPLQENFNNCEDSLDKNGSKLENGDDKNEENNSKINKIDQNKSLDNGVSRKLFLDDDDSSPAQEIVDENNETDTQQNIEEKLDENKKNEISSDEKNLNSLCENNSLENSDTKTTEEPVTALKPVKRKPNLHVFLNETDDSETTLTPSNSDPANSHEKLILNDKNNWPSQNSIEDIFASPPSISEKPSSFQSVIENSQPTTTEKSQNLITLKKLSRISSIPIPSLKPKLRGTPGMDIDLSEDIRANKKAVNSLRNRFITKHAVVNKKEEKKTEVTVLSTEITDDGVVITNDVLPYSLKNIESTDDPKLNKPGAKYVRLKEELEKKMAIKRAEEWKQKEKEFKMDEEEEEEDEEDDDDDDCKFDKEKEKIFNDEEEESEPEENDVIIKDKKRKIHEFDDDEAEVDDPEMELSDDEEEEEARDDEEEEEEGEDDEDDQEELNDDENTETGKKKFSRIVTVDEDSDDESSNKENDDELNEKIMERTRTDVDIFNDNDDDDDSVSYQKPLETSPQNSPPPSSIIPLTSPSTQRSQLLNSSIPESPLLNPSAEYRRLFGTQNIESPKLFNTQNSQISDNELMSLLSGKFPDSACSNKPDLKGLVNTQPSQVTDSQLLKLCSGSFPTTQPAKQTIPSDDIDDSSQDIRLTLDELSQPEPENENHFKNFNDSPLSSLKSTATNTSSPKKSPIKSSTEENKAEHGWTKFTVVSSSDDESQSASLIVNKKKVLKKKKVQQLVLSDDENEADDSDGKKVIYDSEEEEEEEEEILLSDDEKIVDYDSEENEIIISKKDINKVAAKFVDAEAELSESEWGSEDEDERGLDKMEAEAGDAEDIDEDEMRNQIGKVHARQLLDEDQRDVRLLQEMLLDDGDLHDDGGGRERKFKWKNIDNLGMDNSLGPRNDGDDDDDGENDDDNQDDVANELEYRKRRLEREKFLQEKRKTDDDEDLKLMNGKIFKLGLRMIEKSKTNGCAIDESGEGFGGNFVSRNVSEISKSAVKIPGSLNKPKVRGGFLKRGDAALARLATVIKPSDLNGLKSNNTRNFVFSHVSPSIAGPSKNNKSDDEDGCSNEKQVRKRKSTSGMTPTTTKKSRLEVEHLSRKKIF